MRSNDIKRRKVITIFISSRWCLIHIRELYIYATKCRPWFAGIDLLVYTDSKTLQITIRSRSNIFHHKQAMEANSHQIHITQFRKDTKHSRTINT